MIKGVIISPPRNFQCDIGGKFPSPVVKHLFQYRSLFVSVYDVLSVEGIWFLKDSNLFSIHDKKVSQKLAIWKLNPSKVSSQVSPSKRWRMGRSFALGRSSTVPKFFLISRLSLHKFCHVKTFLALKSIFFSLRTGVPLTSLPSYAHSLTQFDKEFNSFSIKGFVKFKRSFTFFRDLQERWIWKMIVLKYNCLKLVTMVKMNLRKFKRLILI